MTELTWVYKTFTDLHPEELYAILQLRNAVFVVEQDCPYQDADDKDQLSYHLCGWNGKNLAAYARVIPPGISYAQASIGRVVTSPSFRKHGAGKALMEQAIDKTLNSFNVNEIKIGAQLYLNKFYTNLGFIQSGPEYLEDGIPHIEMLLVK